MLRPTATQVRAEKDYSLLITFDNGEEKRLHVRPFIKGDWYGHLADPDYFRRVMVDGFTVVWPEGQDLCPDDVYELSEAL